MLALTGGNLIDGAGGPPLPDATVLVNGQGRIEAVGPRRAVALPPDCQVLDITGLTLLPGLIDCHDHLTSFGYDLMGRWGRAEPRSTRIMRVAKVMEETLLTGYTAIRDCGWLDIGYKRAVEQGVIPGPRLQLATSPLSPTQGTQDRSSPSGHHQPPPLDPNLPRGIADGPDDVRAMVREVVRAGADVIKFFNTGFGRETQSGTTRSYTQEETQALVDEAHIHGKTVACHALGGPGLRTAIEAGVDSIEHGCLLGLEPDLLKMMAGKGIYLVPTFTVFTFHATQGNPHAQAEAKGFHRQHMETVQKALSAGVKVVAGTDAGAWEHGNNAKELELLVEAGMTPMQALVAATGWAAGCLGLADSIGTIEPGKFADLIVVDGDPLADVVLLQDKQRIRLVMKEGQVYLDRLSGVPPSKTPTI
ncbi:MAG: amidohydrolase family protein [Chloroflexi bacterium]|nr:amidohydrolase family protein [Chloroflexota bacterium]